MADTPISSQIVASRDAIKTQIWDLIQQYMELENVDPVQSSFLSFLIDIMSTLTSNLMFYQTSVYREFFITQAQLPESVHNLSSFLGYQPSDAQYATVDLLIKFPLPFNDPNAYFTFPSGFEFLTTDGIPFVTYYDVSVQITGNAAAVVTANDSGRIYNLPVDVDTTSENQIQFVLPLRPAGADPASPGGRSRRPAPGYHPPAGGRRAGHELFRQDRRTVPGRR